MKVLLFYSYIVLFLAGPSILAAQEVQQDTRETLDWVQRQANRIDTVLHDAVRSQEPVNLLLKLWWAWQEFDAIAQAGIYCNAARIAAEKGRLECDLLGYERDQDLNAMLIRATEARRHAHQMRMAATACAEAPVGATAAATSFTPRDILRLDADIVKLDLTDAQATRDMHIVAQKLEHAVRLLHDMEVLAQSMDGCTAAYQSAKTVKNYCQEALLADTWAQALPFLEKAVSQTDVLKDQTGICR